jgi:hypothetical protein
MERYPKAFKYRVCGAYQKGKRGKGFGALSKRFGVAKSVIETWHEKWDLGGQTPEAFEDNAGGDRRSILTPKEKERHILDYVSLKNSKREPVDYVNVHKNVVKQTKKDISERTVQRIGKEEMGLTWKETTQSLESDESRDYKESVAKYRRKCQRVPKEKLIFLDGTGMNSEPRPTHSLAPAGKKAKVRTKKPKRYQPRLDIWGAISYNKALAIDIQTSEQRKERGVKGYGKKDVKTFLRKKVAPQVAKMKENVIVGMDRGFHFKPHEVEDELKKGGAKNIEDVWIFPTNAGKLCNPLDNNLWHSMKQNVRKSHPDGEEATAKVLKKVFMKTPSKDLHAYYRNCALTHSQDPYKELND